MVSKEELERAKAAVTNLWNSEGLSVYETPYLPRDRIYVMSWDRNPNKCSVLKGVGGGEKPQRKEPVMASLTTYAYEVLVTEKRDEQGKVVRPKTLVAHEEHLLDEPTREGLLVRYAGALAEFKDEKAIASYEGEVVVNVRRFRG